MKIKVYNKTGDVINVLHNYDGNTEELEIFLGKISGFGSPISPNEWEEIEVNLEEAYETCVFCLDGSICSNCGEEID